MEKLTRIIGLFSVIFCVLNVNDIEGSYELRLENNQYKGLVIAIGYDVPENSDLIEGIKSVFTEASGDLFVATKYRSYFKEITILVPKSWAERPEYEPATLETDRGAHVLVDIANPMYGNTPYVKQPRDCGQPGSNMHLTPEFVLNKETMIATYGNLGKVIVHEWAHLRWGVFDEYPDGDAYPNFYNDAEGSIQATRCSRSIRGRRSNVRNGRACRIDETTGLPEADCMFFVDPDNTATSSYMFQQYMSEITNFCDNEDTSGMNRHNSDAPNKQNAFCNGRSVWEVMEENSDFASGANGPISEGVIDVDTEPTFKLVQLRDRRVVLVLDVSGSMGGSKLMKLKEAVTEFLRTDIEEGSKVAIVTFNGLGSMKADLTEITDDPRSRGSLNAAVVDLVAGGGTSIGAGVQYAIQILEARNVDPRGSEMVIMTDGEENAAPYVASFTEEMVEKGITPTIMLFGAAGSEAVAAQVRAMGGSVFFASEGTDSTGLADAFTGYIYNNPNGDIHNMPLTLSSAASVLPRGSSQQQDIFIDSSIGRDTEFMISFASSYISDIDVTLTSPSGDVYDSGYPGYTESNVDLFYKRFLVDGMTETGQWWVNVTNSDGGDQVATIIIKSKPLEGAEPIKLYPFLGQATVDLQVSQSVGLQAVPIYAELRKGSAPVLGATLQALVERPNGESVTIKLHDIGAGADVTKDDGIYSGYFVSYSMNGHHSVSVSANDGENGATVPVSAGSRTGAIPISPVDREITFDVASTGSFNRQASAESFLVAGYTPMNNLPPGRIIDLEIVASSLENYTVTLRWTAPGADYDQGKASFYNITVDISIEGLRKNADNSTQVTADDVSLGAIDNPLDPYSEELFVIRIPSSLLGLNASTFAFAVRATDSGAAVGPLSNIVSTQLHKPVSYTAERNTNPVLPVDTSLIQVEEPRSSPSPSYVWVGILIACILIAVVVIGFVVIDKKRDWVMRQYIMTRAFPHVNFFAVSASESTTPNENVAGLSSVACAV